MNREYHRWHSLALNRDMELLVFGHAGAKVLVFPTSLGKYYEWEDRGMIGVLGEQLDRGWIQLFCVDSVDAESWYARWAHPGGRAWRHIQYENYLVNEVVPLMWQKNDNPFSMTTGASFGAYHAANFAFRHPELVRRMIGMSGIYECVPCHYQFTVRVGTVLQDSKLPIRKWLVAVFLITESKKGISANQLRRMVGSTYKTAWYLSHRIRAAMKSEASPGVPRAVLARTAVGPHHHLSAKHLQAYVDEAAFRLTNRGNEHLLRDTLLRLLETRSIPYAELVADG